MNSFAYRQLNHASTEQRPIIDYKTDRIKGVRLAVRYAGLAGNTESKRALTLHGTAQELREFTLSVLSEVNRAETEVCGKRDKKIRMVVR